MYCKLPDGSIYVTGRATRDAEFKVVGEKQSRICRIGLAVGRRKDTTTIYVNVVAWHELASILAQARKGVPILAVGQLKTSTYNDKEYTDLEAEFISVASAASTPSIYSSPASPCGAVSSTEDDDGELPF